MLVIAPSRIRVMVMPLPFTAGLLTLMSAAVAWGFAWRPARRPRPLAIVVSLAAGVAALAVGLASTVLDHPRAGMMVVAGGVCLLAVAAHLLRAPDEGPGGDDQPPEPAVPPPAPDGLDWEAFDRERARWERSCNGLEAVYGEPRRE